MCPTELGCRFLTTVTLAKKLGLRPQTIRKWRVLGCGPPYLRLGTGLRSRALYNIESVEKWLNERSFQSTAAETVAGESK